MRKKEGEMTASLRRRTDSTATAATPPLDDDDLLEEILLRLPPLPSSLPRASLVSDRWRRLVSDPGFVRRFLLRHRRNPPLLGFFDAGSRNLYFVPTLEAPDSVPTGRLSLQFDDELFRLVNSRHGLVLVFHSPGRRQVLVWDPVTTDQHHIALPPGFEELPLIHGAVVRVAGDAQHYQVVLVVADDNEPQDRRVLACVYSSETGKWGDIISAPLPAPTSDHDLMVYPDKPPVLVNNSLYWMLAGDLVGILEFDLETRSIAVIQTPVDVFSVGKYEFAVVRAGGGAALGFLFVSKSDCSFQLWKRKTDCDGVASWVLERTIELDKLLPLSSEKKEHLFVVGYAEDNNVVLLWTFSGFFMIYLNSLRFKILPDPNMVSIYHSFESAYAAETCISGGRDGAQLLLNTSTG